MPDAEAYDGCGQAMIDMARFLAPPWTAKAD